MKIFVSALVGAIIFFAWQSISWMALPIHTNSMRYTEGQDAILEAMTAHIPQDGMYMIPYLDPETTTAEDHKAYRESMEGQPWALVNFNTAFESNMGQSMGVGFLLAFITALAVSLVYFFGHEQMGDWGTRWVTSLLIGLAVISFGIMPEANWWSAPMHWIMPEVIDQLVMFALAGIWFAWWWRDQEPVEVVS